MNEARSDARTSILIAILALVVGGLGIYHVEALKGKVVAAEMAAKMATEQALAANSRADELITEVSELRIELAHAQLEMENAGSSQNLGATFEIPTVKAFFETSLASNISSSATSFTLTSATDKEGNTLASSTYALVIDEGTANEEMVLADCTGTACTNVTRGISVVSGTTSVATLMKSHRRGASVKITDGPSLMILSRILNGIGTIPNVLKYGASTADCAAAQEICDYDYVTNLAFNGAGVINATAAAKGVIELAASCEAASSTPTGSTGASLGIPTTLATSTWNSVSLAGCKIVVANNLGKIDSNFLSTTTLFASGMTAGTTTINGSLTLSGGNSTSNIASTSIKMYTSSTTPTVTWTKPATLKYVIVEVVGGGGGGGGMDDAGVAASAGGGAGGYCKKIIPASLLGSTEAVTVGKAGDAGAQADGTGGTGGNSSFGSHCVTTGGAGGIANSDTHAAGGTATGGDININGQGGGAPIYNGSNRAVGGVGGSNPLGYGGSGGNAGGDNGHPATGFGAGGGGAAVSNNGMPGEAGSGGAVIVWEVHY